MNESDDQRLSGLLREVSPPRPHPEAWARIRSRATAPQRRRITSSMLTVAVVLVLLAAGGWGVWRLLASTNPQPILVLQPDGEDVEAATMPPATPPTTAAALADVPPPSGVEAVTAYLEYAVTGMRPLNEDARFSFVWPSGQEWGLWAGNVEVFPADTDQLPPEFYEPPVHGGLPPLPDFITDIMTFLDPESIPKPLWVFATDGDPSPAADVMKAAVAAERPVIVVGASVRRVSAVLGIPPDQHTPVDDPVTARTFVRYAPWRGASLQVGQILPADYWVQPPKEIEPTPTPAETYALLAAVTLAADPPPLSEEEGITQDIADGWYYGFWAGNVEVIPEHSAHLPDFFYSGPTPKPVPRTDQPPAFVDPTAINKPLWVMGDEVNPLDYTERIRAAAAAERPIMFYATTEEVAEAALGIKDNGSSSDSSPLSLQIRPWWPWQTHGGLGVYTWQAADTSVVDGKATDLGTSPAWVFRMLAEVSLQPPRGIDNSPRQEPLSREELVSILTAGYRGIRMILALPATLPGGFVAAESYRPATAPGGASAGSAIPPPVDNPSIAAAWWGVRYTRDAEAPDAGFWLLAGLATAPRAAVWREVGETAAFGAVSVAHWGDVTWVRVGDGEPALYLVGPAAMEEAMVEAAKAMEEVSRR